MNTNVENIGARRLSTVMERILDDISFDASDKQGEKIVIDGAFVREPYRRPRQERRSFEVYSLGNVAGFGAGLPR